MRERGFANHCMGHCFCNDKYSYLICGITKWIFKEKSHLYFRTTTTTAKLLSEPSSFRTLYHEWRVNPFWSPVRFICLFLLLFLIFWDVGISLLFNMLSRLVITFLPRSKRLLTSWLQSSSAVILEPQKIKVSHYFHCFPSICHEVMGPDAMIWQWINK